MWYQLQFELCAADAVQCAIFVRRIRRSSLSVVPRGRPEPGFLEARPSFHQCSQQLSTVDTFWSCLSALSWKGNPTSRSPFTSTISFKLDRRQTVEEIAEATHFSKTSFEVINSLPQFWQSDDWYLLYDNAPAHRSQLKKDIFFFDTEALKFDIFQLQETKSPVRLFNTTNQRRTIQGHETLLKVKGDIEDVSSELDKEG
ncbi:uncharacterized protein TNCV_1006841 [Trichonephila clavipes]|nr:uncharacterized protein TNCV_1006841 [Trichonephila clavipes]